MFSKLKNSLFSDFIIYGIGSVVSRSIGLILTPFLAQALLPSEFGIINLANTTSYFLGIFVVFALDSATGRWYFDSEDINYRKSTVSNWFWFQFVACISVLLISILFARNISYVIFLDKNAYWFFLLPIVGLPLNALVMIFQNLERLRKRPVSLTFFNIALTGLNVCFTLFYLLYLRLGVIGYLLGQLTTTLVLSLFAFVKLRNWIHPKYFDYARLKDMLRFSLPMVPTAVAFWLLNSSATYFLNYILKNKHEVGLFGIGASIAALISLVTTSFQMAWGVFFMSIYQKSEAPEKVSRIANVFMVICFSLWLFICLFSPEFLILFASPSYYGAAWVPCILSLGPILYSMSYFTQVGCYVKKNMKPVATAVLLGGTISIGLYFLLIPRLGKEGAAFSTVAGQLLIPIYVYIRGNKYYPVRYNLIFISFVIGAALLLGISGRMLPMQYGLALGGIKMIIIFIYFLLCFWLTAIFDKQNYRVARGILQKIKFNRNVRNSRNSIVA
ncbi:MAG: polysaccharide biosynthesis protein [Flaviaesturariibacter sp.]|nr:polysaccharide biosynthesis protein [Flaviaesturariibacter sp.]